MDFLCLAEHDKPFVGGSDLAPVRVDYKDPKKTALDLRLEVESCVIESY